MPQADRATALFAASRQAGFNPAYMGAVLDTIALIEKSVNVVDYGAVGDGLADDTSAFHRAVAALSGGGVMVVPPGFYRVTDEIRLRSGITVRGACSADFVYGDPPASYVVPSFIFQDTPGKSIFVLGGGDSRVRVEDVSLSASRHPTSSPRTDGRIGIRIEGSWPSHVWTLVFDRLTFYDLEYGIFCNDPKAGGARPDWSIAPVSIRDCQFHYPKIGVYVNTTNADQWVIERSAFFVPKDGDGVYLHRSGMMRFTNSFGGGQSIANNHLLRIKGHGRLSVDTVVLDQVQAETLTAFLKLETTGGYGTFPFYIIARDCIAEMGADVYLGNQCRFISENNRYSGPVKVDHAGVRLRSVNDRFEKNGSFMFLKASARTSFDHFSPGPDTAPGYEKVTYKNGARESRGTAPPGSGAASVGDIVWNREPASGSPVGWVCTKAGTPGTWNGFGQISG